MDTIELEIVEKLEQISNILVQEKNDTTKWTRDIKTELFRIGDSKGYSVYTSKANDYDNTTNEYLYDMLWYTPEDENENQWDLKAIHLALESEWDKSFSAIKYDFYKLIQARAEHRVMIFQSTDVNKTILSLTNIINNSLITKKGDRYLLAAWNDNDGFTFELVIKTP